jgi:hypothetical protein
VPIFVIGVQIACLVNFYKIISRLINMLLHGIVDRILSRAQKGFTKSRQIQEVIIYILETADYCKKNKETLSILTSLRLMTVLLTAVWKRSITFLDLGIG